MAVDEEQGQAGVAEAPGPRGLAVDPPAGFVPLDYGGLTEQLEELVDDGGEEVTAPAEVTEQTRSADGQAEEVVEQVPSLAQGDAEVSPAGAGEPASARADVRARQFQVTAALAGPLTAPAVVNMTPVAMPLEFRFGQIGHEVVLELAGGFAVAGTTMGALHRTDVVFDEDGAGWGFGSEESGVLAVFLAPPVGGETFGIRAAGAWAFTTAADVLEFVFDQRQAAPQVRILGFQLGDPLLQGAHPSQDGGLCRRWDRVPQGCRDRRLRSHIPTTRYLYKRFDLITVVRSSTAAMERPTA
jgi:hypothetical protein